MKTYFTYKTRINSQFTVLPGSSHLPARFNRSLSHQITFQKMSCSSESVVPTLRTVTISYSELKASSSPNFCFEVKLCVYLCKYELLESCDRFWSWLKQDKNADLSVKIEQGFGANGLGILAVTDVWIQLLHRYLCIIMLCYRNMTIVLEYDDISNIN